MKKLAQAAAITGVSVLTIAGVSACSSSSNNSSSSSPSTQTYNANGVTFQYPQGWNEETASVAASTGNQLWSQTFGADDTKLNLAIVSSYSVNVDVTNENVSQLQGQIETTISDLAKQAQGSITTPVSVQNTAGFPGYTAQIQVTSPSGSQVDSTLWLFFNGKTEYFINCQYESAQKEQMLAGCNVIRDTFKTTS